MELSLNFLNLELCITSSKHYFLRKMVSKLRYKLFENCKRKLRHLLRFALKLKADLKKLSLINKLIKIIPSNFSEFRNVKQNFLKAG